MLSSLQLELLRRLLDGKLCFILGELQIPHWFPLHQAALLPMQAFLALLLSLYARRRALYIVGFRVAIDFFRIVCTIIKLPGIIGGVMEGHSHHLKCCRYRYRRLPRYRLVNGSCLG
jgi:hypothetical protein